MDKFDKENFAKLIMKKCGGGDYCDTYFNILDFMPKKDIIPNMTLFVQIRCSSDSDQLTNKNLLGMFTACLGAIIIMIFKSTMTYEDTK